MPTDRGETPETMRAIEITEPGGPEVLKLTERSVPAPGDNEVLIKIKAAGVNRPDVFQRMGLYPPPPGASDLPGLEVSGEVIALGIGAKKWKIGDKVCALLPGGGYAEYAVAHEGAVLPVPNRLSMKDAAGLPETFFTVWANVFDDAKLQAGETFLVHGGTSGIGVTAIAMAKAMGARVIATASSDEKCAAIKSFGADVAYRYDLDVWEKKIQDEGGADVILDMTGGDFVPRNLEALNVGGRHVSIATLRGMEATINLFVVMRKQLRLSGSTMKARGPADKARLAAGLKETIWPLIEAGRITPAMAKTFDLAGAAEAHKRMESGAHIGKIVLKVA